MDKKLIYVLVNYDTKEYLKMFKIFIESLVLFSDISKFDLLIICDENAYPDIKKIQHLKKFNCDYLIRPVDKDLKHALLRKFDIAEYDKFMDYSKILYIDVDIIVQKDIMKVFESIPRAKHNTLYATKEGTLEGKYWFLDSYHKSNIEKMKKEKINSFNSGMFMFVPSTEMKAHFKNVKKIAIEYYKKNEGKLSQSFYDQSFMNYYFNLRRLVNTNYMNELYIMFPDTTKLHPTKTVLHISGLGRYKEKALIMKKYLKLIIS